MTKKELAQKVKTILQTVAGIIILGCVGATYQYFHQPTVEEVIDEKIVEIKEEKASVDLPTQLPEQFTEMIGKRLAELLKLKEVNFVKKESK